MILSPADILLPDFEITDCAAWEKYPVIACDQFTSEPEYWEKAQKITSGAVSTLDYILPEAYLGSDKEKLHSEKVSESMKKETEWKVLPNSMVYLERTLPDGKVRRGIVGKIDLEEYDFTADSSSGVHATEETVISRIPPRVKIRGSATVEFPHIMLFSDDTGNDLFANIAKTDENVIYDFDLMLGGGHIKGWRQSGEDLEKLLSGVENYEKSKNGGLVYAVGDGNHSLASAKAFYENVKNRIGADAERHPARYALVEIVDLSDASIEFEPIYRIVTDCNVNDLISALKAVPSAENTDKTVTTLTKEGRETLPAPSGHPLTVGALQIFIDSYVKAHPEAHCDYIHGTESLEKLSKSENTVGFLFEGIAKSSLFSYVSVSGCLPRKTFSMGEAKSKRYYLEARKIVL